VTQASLEKAQLQCRISRSFRILPRFLTSFEMEKPNESYTDLHPTYQISFTAEDVGKRFAASKREIRWYAATDPFTHDQLNLLHCHLHLYDYSDLGALDSLINRL